MNIGASLGGGDAFVASQVFPGRVRFTLRVRFHEHLSTLPNLKLFPFGTKNEDAISPYFKVPLCHFIGSRPPPTFHTGHQKVGLFVSRGRIFAMWVLGP